VSDLQALVRYPALSLVVLLAVGLAAGEVVKQAKQLMTLLLNERNRNMERFWNIIHFIAYKFFTKFYLFLMTIDPILNIVYKTDWAKKRFEKMGKDSVKEVKFALTDKRIGQSAWFAGLLMIGMPTVFLFGLHIFIFFAFKWLRDVEFFSICLIIFYVILSSLLNFYLLFRRDKYIKYFKKFEKQPRKWKVKWAWISAGIILFPFLVLAGSFIATLPE
jgi:hypothetical protein